MNQVLSQAVRLDEDRQTDRNPKQFTTYQNADEQNNSRFCNTGIQLQMTTIKNQCQVQMSEKRTLG